MGDVSNSSGHAETLTIFGKPVAAQSGFLFDYFCLIWHNDSMSEGANFGHLKSCPLAMETEWHSYDKENGPDDRLHHDFRKPALAKAENKVFIFIDSGHVGLDTVEQLKLQAMLLGGGANKESYLISFYLDKCFHHHTFEV